MPDQQRKHRRERWEERARQHGDQPRGVLFQGLPAPLNQAIDQWHARLVASVFAAHLPPHATVLDLAAGYGRLSRVLQYTRPDVWVSGADLSLTYTKLYAGGVAPAVCADLAALPYAAASCDGLLLVTGLMYLEENELGSVLDGILCCLKPGGVLLCIDPGVEIMRWLRLLRPQRQLNATGGNGFGYHHYRALFARPDCTLICQGGNTFFTLALPLLLLCSCPGGPFSSMVRTLAGWVVSLDSRLGLYSRFALHRWLFVQKNDD